MERIMRTQAMGDARSMEYMKVGPVFFSLSLAEKASPATTSLMCSQAQEEGLLNQWSS